MNDLRARALQDVFIPTGQAARDALDTWTESEIGRQYPAICRQGDATWEQLTPFFAFSPGNPPRLYA